MPAAEPTLSALSNPLLRYFLATRPAFLSVTLFAVLIGLGSARHGGVALDAGAACVTLVFALLAHAGVNVLNDYYDALNGTDASNTERIFPFTGGSRFIQNGVLGLRETAAFGASLFAVVILAGLWLTWVSGPALVWIGAVGLFIGWAYSAPPLALNGRGLGEICVWAGFALIAVGTDYVQRGELAAAPLAAVAGYALLVTNLLYVNQFPDRRADEAAGKRHWVVRLGPRRARWLYVAIGVAAYVLPATLVALGVLVPLALISLLAAPLTVLAARELLRHAAEPARLAPAIRRTVAAASLHGLLMACALALAPLPG